MSDAQTLFLILCLFYLSDCFLWIKKESVAFVSPWCKGWRLAAIDSLFGNNRGRFFLMNPLPPFGRIFFSNLAPLSISPEGVCAFNLQSLPWGRPAHTGQCLRFEEIHTLSTDGSELLINKQSFAKCASATQAKALARLLNSLKDVDARKRDPLIGSYIDKQFADRDARTILSKSEELMKPIHQLCVILFVFLFIGTPLLVTFTGLLPVLIPLGFIMFALASTIAVMFYRAHKTLYPDESQERFEGLVKMILCPPIAIRAMDLLSKNLLSQFSPIVVADVLVGANGQQFVRSFVLDLQHPLKHEIAEDSSVEMMEWAASEQLTHALEYINRSNYPKNEILLAGPARTEDSSFYCPRCGCQFVSGSDSCPDCPGVRLLSFGTQAAPDSHGAA